MRIGASLPSELSHCKWRAWLDSTPIWAFICACDQLRNFLFTFLLIQFFLHGFFTAFCRGALSTWFSQHTLYIPVAFCSGANYNFLVNCAKHGQHLAFCRGDILAQAYNRLKALVAYYRCVSRGGFTLSLCLWAFCSGALGTIFGSLQVLRLHGNLLAFCRGAHYWWTYLTALSWIFCCCADLALLFHLLRWHALKQYSDRPWTRLWTQRHRAFCGGATLAPKAFCGGATFAQIHFLIIYWQVATTRLSILQRYLCFWVWQQWIFWTRDNLLHLRQQLQFATHGTLLAFCRGALYKLLGIALIYFTIAQRFICWLLHLLANWALVLHKIFYWLFDLGPTWWLFDRLQVTLPCNSVLPSWDHTPGRSPGPKSGRSRHCGFCNFFTICLLATSLLHQMVWNGGEGCISEPCGDAEADLQWTHGFYHHAAKLHGTKPTMCYGTQVCPGAYPKTVKRGYIRAIKRAQKLGCTWYKGRMMQLDEFPRALLDKMDPTGLPLESSTPSKPLLQHMHVAKRRLKIVTWNSGGLSAARFDELRNWGLQQHADIILVPETRWQYTNEWQDSDWCCIHSGDSASRGSGLLCMISRKLQKMQSIKWLDVIPGRILHVRLAFASRCVDFLGCYQFAMGHQQHRKQERQTWWTKLDHYMQRLPRRNMLVLAGDFNCSVGALNSHVGASTFHWRGAQCAGTAHFDTGTFASLIKNHGLFALNSWDSTQGPTYIKQDVSSRLDFIFVKKQTADGAARTAKHLWNAPFLSVPLDGHAPVFAHIPFHWHHAQTHALGSGITAHQRQQGREAWLNDTSQWHTFVDLSTLNLTNVMTQVSPYDTAVMDHLHDSLIHCFKTCFPSHAMTSSVPVWKRDTQIIQNKWFHRDCIRRLCTSSLANVLKAWLHVVKYTVLQRQSKIHARTVRQARLNELLHEASIAASKHDSYRLFSIINRVRDVVGPQFLRHF